MDKLDASVFCNPVAHQRVKVEEVITGAEENASVGGREVGEVG